MDLKQSPRIPRDLIFGNPEKVSPKVSPDGSAFSYLAPLDGVLNIWAGKTIADAKPVTRDRGRGIRSYFWAGDGRTLLYVQDKDGDENWHLWRADAAAPEQEARDLTPFPGVQVQVIGTHPAFPDEALIGINRRDARVHDVYRLNIQTGFLEIVEENPGDVIGWLPDDKFRIRCVKAMRGDGGSELRVRETAENPWRTFLSWGPDDSGGAHGFTPSGDGLYVESSADSDTTQLWEMSLDGKSRKLLASCPDADVAGVLIHPVLFHAEACAFERERLEWRILDSRVADDFKIISRELSGDFQIVSRDDADKTWIVSRVSDCRPVSYYRYDRAGQSLNFMFSARPALDSYQLSPMRPVAIAARDGLSLKAYLSVPQGREPKNLPLVLHVHGGPWARDSWGFHPEVQWLADQGYAVLQVNFRGSAGFGKSFLHAGDRQWGARMQDDLTDSVSWAVREGVADPKRVAIYGASYGGYAALCGAAFTPDVYRCAVDVVGPSNLITLVKSIPPYWEPLRRVFDLRVGNADTEPEFLESRSPLFFADHIRAPILIAQGANDPRVKKAESESVAQALRAKGKEVEYLLFPDEGHGLAKPENRLKFYAACEAFLARHLSDA
ncbi:MAG: S9 family peptidase [Elusimicrobiota bacterium]